MFDLANYIAGTASITALVVSFVSILKSILMQKRELKKYEKIHLELINSEIKNALDHISLSITKTQKDEFDKDELKKAIEHLERSLADIRAEKKSENIYLNIEKSIEKLKPLTIKMEEEDSIDFPSHRRPLENGGEA